MASDGDVVIGRWNYGSGDEVEERAPAELAAVGRVEYVGGAIGAVTVELCRSLDETNRGGVMLRITSRDDASSFLPFARVIPGGVELHMCGDIEARSMLEALFQAIVPALPGGK